MVGVFIYDYISICIQLYQITILLLLTVNWHLLLMSNNSLMGHEFTNKDDTIKFVVQGASFLRESIAFQLDFFYWYATFLAGCLSRPSRRQIVNDNWDRDPCFANWSISIAALLPLSSRRRLGEPPSRQILPFDMLPPRNGLTIAHPQPNRSETLPSKGPNMFMMSSMTMKQHGSFIRVKK